MIKISCVVRPCLTGVLLIMMKRSTERWNKSSICYVQVMWFGPEEKDSPKYTLVVSDSCGGILEDGVSLGPPWGPYAEYAMFGMFWCSMST